MALVRQVPGERLVARMSLRLAHSSGLAAGGGLAQRLAQRAALRAGAQPALVARLDRWEHSPMVAWAGVLMGESAPRPFAFSGIPQPVLAMSLEPSLASDSAEPQRARTPRRAAPRAARAPLVVPGTQAVASSAQAVSPSAPRPSRQAPVGAGVLQRSSARVQARPQASPLRSAWARRLMAPAAVLSTSSASEGLADPSAPQSQRPQPGLGPRRSTAPRAVPRSPMGSSPRRQLAQADTSPPQPVPGVRAQPRTRDASSSSPPYPPRTASVAGPAAVLDPPFAAPPTALDHLDQRQTRPVGVVAARLAAPAQQAHPAARGFEAVRPEAAPLAPDFTGEQAPPAPLLHHPARSMLHALARAGSPQEAARVVVERAAEIRATRDLPAPLADVVQQIQQQVQLAARKASLVAPSGRVAAQTKSRQHGESSLPSAAMRLTRGTSGSGSGSGEVVSLATMRLLRRLQQLVHIAETDRRLLEAQRRVRMAEDSAHARAEAASAPGADAAGDAQPVDLDTLGREVLAAVTDKLATRNDRRLEDPDVPIDVF